MQRWFLWFVIVNYLFVFEICIYFMKCDCFVLLFIILFLFVPILTYLYFLKFLNYVVQFFSYVGRYSITFYLFYRIQYKLFLYRYVVCFWLIKMIKGWSIIMKIEAFCMCTCFYGLSNCFSSFYSFSNVISATFCRV